jgi:Chaperone of endosialidase
MSILQVSNIVGPTTIDATTANATSLAVTGGASVYRKTNTGNVDNSLTLGTTNKASSSSNYEGYVHIKSNDATNQLRGWMRLITDSTQANRRLAIDAYEDNVAARNVTLVESGGNVGIGTSSPGVKLEVVGGILARATNVSVIARDTGGSGTGAQSGFQTQDSTGTIQSFFGKSAIGTSEVAAINYMSGGTLTLAQFGAGNIILQTNGLNRMQIDGSGNVGIGTASPATGFHISDKTLRITSASGNPTIQMGRTNGFALVYNATDNRFAINYDAPIGTGSLTALQIDSLGRIGINGVPDDQARVHSYCNTVTNNYRGILLGGAHDCTNFISIAAYGTYNYDHFGAWTIDSGGTGTNVFRVASTGQMQATSFYNTGQRIVHDRSWENYPSICILNDSTYGPQGELRFHGAGGASGGDFSVVVRSDGGYVTGSDARRKTNVESIENALDIVKNLDGKKFNVINRDGDLDPITGDKKQYGFIAQECIDVIPEAVTFYEESDTPNENGWASAYSISYDKLTAVLVNAIKELSAKNDRLEAIIASGKLLENTNYEEAIASIEQIAQNAVAKYLTEAKSKAVETTIATSSNNQSFTFPHI